VITFIYGALVSFIVILATYVLPLYITAKEREKHSYFEIPMAAQILAIINAANLLLSAFYATLITAQDLVMQLIGAVLMCIALIPLLP
jgi:hypothetical protein